MNLMLSFRSLVLFALTLVLVHECQLAVRVRAFGEEEDVDDLYCPPRQDIIPCSCDREGLSCIDVGNRLDEQRARQVFKAHIATDKIVDSDDPLVNEKESSHDKIEYYASVWIQGTALERVTCQTLGNFSFDNIYLDLNKIGDVEARCSFAKSYALLRTLTLHRNVLQHFPFDGNYNCRCIASFHLSIRVHQI